MSFKLICLKLPYKGEVFKQLTYSMTTNVITLKPFIPTVVLRFHSEKLCTHLVYTLVRPPRAGTKPIIDQAKTCITPNGRISSIIAIIRDVTGLMFFINRVELKVTGDPHYDILLCRYSGRLDHLLLVIVIKYHCFSTCLGKKDIFFI